MATQRCPKCKSYRVRLGYRPTSTLQKIFFRYNLLCDECNWEFTGFAIPGTVAKKTKKKRTNAKINTENEPEVSETEANIISEILIKSEAIEKNSESKIMEKTSEKNVIRKKSKKVKAIQPPLFENVFDNEVNNPANGNIKSNEPSLKKQKVKKRVRVKFY